MAQWREIFKKGLAFTRSLTKALMGLGGALLLGALLLGVWGDSQEASKPTQPSSNKTAGFPSGQEKQLSRASRQLVQVSTACPEWGTPALFKAAVLQRCLAEGLNPNAKIQKISLLAAVILGAEISGQDTTEAVQVLLEAGANVNARDKEGDDSPLILASGLGHTVIVQALLDAGADLNLQNEKGATALIAASGAGHTATVRALLDAGANVNAQSNVVPRNRETQRLQGLTALIAASRAGHTAIVQTLLDADAGPNMQSEIGATALIAASEAGHTATVQALLDAGANVNLQIRSNASRYDSRLFRLIGFTALMFAANHGHTATVQALLDAGADLDVQSEHGQTASTIAEAIGHTEIMNMIERAAAFR